MVDKIEIALDVMNIFTTNGCDIYLVGGSVRDMLLNLPIKDIDLTTNCTPEQVDLIAKSNNIPFIPTGLEHGTGTIIYREEQIQITTFRIDKLWKKSRCSIWMHSRKRFIPS